MACLTSGREREPEMMVKVPWALTMGRTPMRVKRLSGSRPVSFGKLAGARDSVAEFSAAKAGKVAAAPRGGEDGGGLEDFAAGEIGHWRSFLGFGLSDVGRFGMSGAQGWQCSSEQNRRSLHCERPVKPGRS